MKCLNKSLKLRQFIRAGLTSHPIISQTAPLQIRERMVVSSTPLSSLCGSTPWMYFWAEGEYAVRTRREGEHEQLTVEVGDIHV